MKLPAYGKHLISVVNNPRCWRRYVGTSPDGKHLTIWIAIGPFAWDWARVRISRFLIAVIPENENPDQFMWNFAKGHDPVLVIQCGELPPDTIQRLVVALMRDGVQRVLMLGERDTTLYKDAAYVQSKI